MSVLERCQYQRSVCISEVSVLGGVSIREVLVLERCQYQRSVRIRELFALERFLY